MSDSLEQLICRVLQVPELTVTCDLSFQSIPEWDSMRHLQLMAALQKIAPKKITGEDVARLTSLASIKAFLSDSETEPTPCAQQSTERISRGLADVYLDLTTISNIDGNTGKLWYRGVALDELLNESFERVCYLLLNAQMPSDTEYDTFCQRLASVRQLDPALVQIIENVAHLPPLSVMAIACHQMQSPTNNADGLLQLIAVFPTILGIQIAVKNGKSACTPDKQIPHAQHLFQMLTGKRNTKEFNAFLNRDLILHAEHGCSASTFAARVAIGAGSNPFVAIASALSTFAGTVHGGAMEAVANLKHELLDVSAVEAYVKDKLSKGEAIPGFGHRVYKGADPRVEHYRDLVQELHNEGKESKLRPLALKLEEVVQHNCPLGPFPNVDLFAAVAYDMIGTPEGFGSALFACGRIAGWIAHINEQQSRNILIRPKLLYDEKA